MAGERKRKWSDSSKRRRDRTFVNVKQTASTYITSRGLSKSQELVIERIFKYFCNILDYNTRSSTTANATMEELHSHSIIAPHILLTGDPGSGKSYTTDTVRELASIMGIGHVATTSFNGITAINVHGNTIICIYDQVLQSIS